MSQESTMDIREIARYLPHRYPFLLLDRVLECVPGSHLRALKNVTFNEPFFQGHFPHEAIMPGVLQVEAMAQSAGIWAMKTIGANSESSVYFMMIDKVRFRQPVRPGDQLIMKVEVTKPNPTRSSFSGKAYVNDKLVSQAEMVAMIKR